MNINVHIHHKTRVKDGPKWDIILTDKKGGVETYAYTSEREARETAQLFLRSGFKSAVLRRPDGMRESI